MRRAFWLLAFLCVVPLWAGLGNDLQDVDPAQYAEVSRQMSDSGDWAHLKQNGAPFLNKPPLTFWMISSAFALLGQTSAAVRLPSVLCALLLLWATYRIGRKLWDARTGALAAALLCASVGFQLMVADPKIDMVVTAWMAMAVLCLVEARERRWAIWPAWLFAILGILTKGPIGLIAPAVAIAPEALRRRWGARDGEAAGTLWARIAVFRPLWGLALAAGLLAPWFFEAYREFGSWALRYLLWEQSFGRLVGERGYRNDTTPLFFVHTAAWAFLPMTPLLAVALWQRARGFVRARFRLAHDERRLVLWWLVFPFAAVSLSSYRLPQYIYWLAPPVALLSGRALVELAQAKKDRALESLRWIHLALGGLAAALCAALVTAAFPPEHRFAAVAWPGLVALATAAAALARRHGPQEERVALAAVLPLAAFHLYFAASFHPSLTAYHPDRAFGEIARREDPDGKILPFVEGRPGNASAFYARRRAVSLGPAELRLVVARGEARVAVLSPAAIEAVEREGVLVHPLAERPWFPTSRPTARFLFAKSRDEVVSRFVIARVELAPAARAPTAAGP